MKKKYCVIGLGDLGKSIAITLSETGAEVIAIDKNMEEVEEIKDKVTMPVRLDSTDKRALKNEGIDKVDAAIVAIGPDDFESTILTSVLLLEIGVKKVIARAASSLQLNILTKLGVHQVVVPDVQIARQIVALVSSEEIIDSIPLGDDYSIIYVKVPKIFVGKSLLELDLRIRYNINLITIKRKYPADSRDEGNQKFVERIYGVPTASTTLEPDDILIVLGRDKDIKKIID